MLALLFWFWLYSWLGWPVHSIGICQCIDYVQKDIFAQFVDCLIQTGAHSTYIYRVQSTVWRLPNYWPPTSSPPSECVLTPHQRRGYTLAGRWGGGGQYLNISEENRHWIGFLQYNPSTDWSHVLAGWYGIYGTSTCRVYVCQWQCHVLAGWYTTKSCTGLLTHNGGIYWLTDTKQRHLLAHWYITGSCVGLLIHNRVMYGLTDTYDT